MADSPPDFTVIPDYYNEKLVLTDRSKALLRGRTIFVVGKNKKFGSIYTLAKNHGMKAHTQRDKYKGVEGTKVWFTPAQD